LTSQADTDIFKTDPTLAAGDIVIYKDGVLDGNIDALPADIGSSGIIPVVLSIDEMTADRVDVLFHDVTGSEWQDLVAEIFTKAAVNVGVSDYAGGAVASVTAPVAVGSIGNDVITDDSIHADAVTKIQNGLALAATFTGITSFANWLRGLGRKDAMDAVAKAELNSGGGTYNEATDSLEAIEDDISALAIASFPAGSIEYIYTVTDSGTGNSVADCEVWISTDIDGVNIIWKGNTDAFGVARDVLGNLPHLDPGTYAFWRHKVSYTDTDPDLEVVS
jgi:hypothetical protein